MSDFDTNIAKRIVAQNIGEDVEDRDNAIETAAQELLNQGPTVKEDI